ncbi:3-oxoacyl-[acyl-carrier protein] reductase [uncultured bacterium]|nr:3-oxoacyl-[acyl-carrier protein] reductase [uncultured bacterium]
MGSLEGKAVIVTGAGSGIGRAAAVMLAAEGASIVAVGRDRAKLEETLAAVTGTGGAGHALVADVTSEADMDRMREETLAAFGKIDGLVASAGVGKGSSSRVFPVNTSILPLSEWDEVLRVNLTGVFLSNRAVLAEMMEKRSGTIINVSSYPAGLKGQPYAPAYSASKFGVAGLTESLAEEMKPFRVKVHAVFPGLTATPMTSSSALSGKFGVALEPEQVAELITYMMALPEDTVVGDPVMMPFKTRKRKGV